MKSSSSSSFKKYQRSVSWGQIVMPAKEELSIVESSISPTKYDKRGSNPGISVITFPNLRRATPLRSDSIGSMTSSIAPSLRMGGPIRSESMSSMISSASMGVPMLSRANPVFSPRMNDFRRVLSLHRARKVVSIPWVRKSTTITLPTPTMSIATMTRRVRRCAFAPKRWLPPRTTSLSALSRQSSAASLTVLIRQALVNNYDGEGMEVDEIESAAVSLGNARNFKSMVSGCDCVVSGRSRSSMRSIIPFQSLDDSFVVRNINFERHSSEILRSLSNEDLNNQLHGSSLRYEALTPQNAWSVFIDEYAEEYGAYKSLSFRILGTSADDVSCHPHVLSLPLMESLRNFLPPGIAENNFWINYSLVRDGASLSTLLRQVRGAQHTLIAIETLEGEVFGCYKSSLCRKITTEVAFLWRMRRTQSEKAKLESELDVFYWTGKNNLVQLCTHDLLAVVGGEFRSFLEGQNDSFSEEERDMPPPQSTKTDPGGFGLAFDAEILRGTSSPCATFNSPPLSREHPDRIPLDIVNLEVWTMTPCLNVEDAEQLEMRKLFLEPYSGSQ
ncbi:LOW QUALITY PROTEIN: hypothetical protein ACHAWO_008274 [Cyclotella atomus]|uniref:Oxidation resistance protein 1 n=1 Tax=Cyclotella atomus TaxID=382360 RepID=A0ABD3PY99_9STRA